MSTATAPGTHAMVAFATRDNPQPQPQGTVTAAFENRHIPRLLELISSADLVIRQKALSTLGSECSNPKSAVTALVEGAIPTLLSCLMDPDTVVRRDALIALRTLARYRGADAGLSCNTKSIRAVAGTLVDSSPAVRLHALETLEGVMKRPGGVETAEEVGMVSVLLTFLDRADIKATHKILCLNVLTELVKRSPTAAESALMGDALPLLTRLMDHRARLAAQGAVGGDKSASHINEASQALEEEVEVSVHCAQMIGALCVSESGKMAATEHEPVLDSLLAGIAVSTERALQSACAATLALIVVHKEAKMRIVREHTGSIDAILALLGVNDEDLVLAGLGVLTGVAEDPQGRALLLDSNRGVVSLLKSLNNVKQARLPGKPASRPSSATTMNSGGPPISPSAARGESPLRVSFDGAQNSNIDSAAASEEDIGRTLATSNLDDFIARAASRAMDVLLWTP